MPDYSPSLDTEGAGGAGAAPEYPYSKKPRLKPGEAKVVKERFACGTRYYENCFKDKAQRSRDLYSGYHWKLLGKPKANKPVINYIKFVVDTQVASIAHQRGEVILKPESPLGQANEDRSRRAANYGYRKAKADRETKRALADCRVYGFGVVMSFWDWETKQAPAIEGRPQVMGEPEDPDAVLAAVEAGEPLPEPVPPQEIVRDYACCRRLDPRSFRISSEADWTLEGAPWCGYVEMRPLDEVKADPRFTKSVTRKLKGSCESLRGLLGPDERGKKDEDLPSDVKRVQLWHYYERRRQIHVVFAEEQDEPLMVEPWYWKHGRYPFRLIHDPLMEDEFYPEFTPPQQWEHMQQAINETRAQLSSHRKRYNRQYLSLPNVLSETNKKKLAAGEDGAILEVEGVASLAGVLEPIQDAPMQAEVYQDDKMSTQDLMTLSATNQYETGRAPTKRVTTTEAEAIQGAGGAIKQEMMQRYETLCAGVAEDIFDLMQQYSAHTMMLPIYSEQDQLQGFEPVSREEIQGDYQFQIAVGSTEIPNRQGRIEEMSFFLQTVMPFIQMGVADPAPLLEQILAMMPDIKDAAAIVKRPPPMGPGMMPPGGDDGLGGAPVPVDQPPPGMAPGGAALPPEVAAMLGG